MTPKFGPRRAVWVEAHVDDGVLAPQELQAFESLDAAYRSLCAMLYNYAPLSGHPGGSISSGRFVATLLFTLQPVVAGHAGLATHDVAATAGLAWSLLTFARWLDEPGVRRAAWFGVAFGSAVLCKFSCIGYVPAACLAMFAVRAIRERVVWRSIAPSLAVSFVVTALVVWVGYGFHFETFVAGIRGLQVIASSGRHFGFLFVAM